MIHNERIKLLAAALNNIGLAFAIGGFVAPSINGGLQSGNAFVAIEWALLGASLHAAAQVVLGRMRP